MARSSSAAARNLTLTEELEKLEQSITLTLQEIDSNFSKAHRIVTTSILPIVEQYGEHSKAVWDGSKFWKGFFESAANVSLSGYAEPDESTHDESQDNSTRNDHIYGSPSVRADDTMNSTAIERSNTLEETDDDSSLLESPTMTIAAQGTPRAPATKPKLEEEELPTFAPYTSSYEELKALVEGTPVPKNPKPQPITPGYINTLKLPDTSTSPPHTSPFSRQLPPENPRNPNNDPLLHRVLDKTYRIQMTPHEQRKQRQPQSPLKTTTTPATATRTAATHFLDSSPLDSSPTGAAPQLRPEIFSSPLKTTLTTPRTPGVSVSTPAKRREIAHATTQRHDALNQPKEPLPVPGGGRRIGVNPIWDSDSDEEEGLEGMSPPKTMQFVVPQGRLLQTPAREASRRIVEDLLLTAGGDVTESGVEGDSPSVVKRDVGLDDSF
ncbi:MAG: DASH complex subunit ask1 [Bogoriella megaspora]|nr:MAG: DASH complex subunit ask1 [Bogoriella megaspora]